MITEYQLDTDDEITSFIDGLFDSESYVDLHVILHRASVLKFGSEALRQRFIDVGKERLKDRGIE